MGPLGNVRGDRAMAVFGIVADKRRRLPPWTLFLRSRFPRCGTVVAAICAATHVLGRKCTMTSIAVERPWAID
jgi:hypothetical protein